MFKRVTKRVKRREDAEKLGVTDEMREAMGMEDTDSDESDSDEEGSSDDNQSKQVIAGSKRKRDDDDDEEDEGSEDEEEAIEEEETDVLSSMTVKEALKSPLEDTSCILCPGKAIKNAQMEQVHLQSAVRVSSTYSCRKL